MKHDATEIKEITNDQLQQALSDVYKKLLASQEPLDPEFENILHKNLWNLYES